MLCHACAGEVEGFNVRSGEIKMRSTARYIGAMERSDKILNNKIVFSGINLDKDERNVADKVAVTPPVFVGFRQLPLERWTSTPLYYLQFKNRKRIAELEMPITVTLERNDPEDEDDEEALEGFQISEAEDARGEDCTNDLSLTFQTLRVEREQEAGYWLDSGVLKVKLQKGGQA